MTALASSPCILYENRINERVTHDVKAQDIQDFKIPNPFLLLTSNDKFSATFLFVTLHTFESQILAYLATTQGKVLNGISSAPLDRLMTESF